MAVSEGHYSVGGETHTRRTGQVMCEVGHYCEGGVKVPCPPGRWSALRWSALRMCVCEWSVVCMCMCK